METETLYILQITYNHEFLMLLIHIMMWSTSVYLYEINAITPHEYYHHYISLLILSHYILLFGMTKT
jgi:hypothetical protein